jgi:penicillin-binding protein 2
MEGTKLYFRVSLLALMLLSFVFISGGRLYNMQIINGDQYQQQSARKITRSYTVPASRGEILDRYGRPLVVNRLSYTLTLDASVMKKTGTNDIIGRLITACEKENQAYSDTLPITAAPPYALSDNLSTQQKSRYDRFLKQKQLTGKSPAEVMAFLFDAYKINPDSDQARKIAGVRYEMELRDLFYNIPAYTFAEDVGIKFGRVLSVDIYQKKL